MKHLRVTHILNVSDKIENYFEDSSKIGKFNELIHVESLNIKYLRIQIEDEQSLQIKMTFPLAYEFIQGAFDESKDFYKNPSKSNPLVDDLYSSQLELNKRQRL